MSQSYEVVTDALAGHARILRDLAGDLEQAAGAAGEVDLTPDSYGEIGQPFVTAMAALARAGQGVLRADVTALESAKTTMDDTVASYQRQETAERVQFGALGQERRR